MGQQNIAGNNHQIGVFVSLKGCMDTDLQPQSTKHLRFVEGHPVSDPIPQRTGNHIRIRGKPVVAFGILPAALSVECRGQIPVIQGDQRLNSVAQQFIAQVPVKLQTCLVDRACPLGQHPGPADGKTVGIQAHLFHQGHVLPPTVVKVDGHVSVFAVGDLAGAIVNKGIPDGLTLTVGVPTAFDLGGGGGSAPQKILGKYAY